MKCCICKKKMNWWNCYGSLFELKTHYCQEHWIERLLEESKESVIYWETELVGVRAKDKYAEEQKETEEGK